jgi:arylsulfatase A-like enzyme
VSSLRVIVVLVALVSCAPDAPPRPNVLLISIDSLRADHVGMQGYARPTTPRLDALAAAGAAFLAAYAPSPWTLPSHVTLLTSLPPEAHGVVKRNRVLASRATTLAEVLQGAGYATAGFVSGPLLRGLYGHDQGFDVYDDERPFFVFLHLWDVHYDYDPPAPYDSWFDPDYAGDLDATPFENNPALSPGMAPRDLEHLVALYDGEIRFTDEWIGRLLDRLAALRIAQDTIVVVTADHGDEFLEHGQLGHGKTLFEEQLRVPLIVSYPRRIPPGRRFTDPVRLQDVAPTILGLADVPWPPAFGLPGGPPGARGVDLSPWLVGSPAESFPVLPVYASSAVLGLKRSVQAGGKKLIVRGKSLRGTRVVYDLTTDPQEKAVGDASKEDLAALIRLGQMLNEWTAFFDEQGIDHSERRALDPEFVEQLRKLGYLE